MGQNVSSSQSSHLWNEVDVGLFSRLDETKNRKDHVYPKCDQPLLVLLFNWESHSSVPDCLCCLCIILWGLLWKRKRDFKYISELLALWKTLQSSLRIVLPTQIPLKCPPECSELRLSCKAYDKDTETQTENKKTGSKRRFEEPMGAG
jgi:hypothetical protein